MNASIVSTASWRCRICGNNNPLHSGSCSASNCMGVRNRVDFQGMQKALSGGMLAQVLNPNAKSVQNNIYNFASSNGDVNVMNPFEQKAAEVALDKWVGPAPVEDLDPIPDFRPKKFDFMKFFFKTVTVICMTIMVTILMVICAVIVMAFMRFFHG